MLTAFPPFRTDRRVAVPFGRICCCIALAGTVNVAAMAADEPFTAEQLRALPALDTELQALPYAERIAWLQAQLDTADSAARRYQLRRAQAFEHVSNYVMEPALQICAELPPQSFDFNYRFLCAESRQTSYEASIRELLTLYDNAMSASNIDVAVRVLSSVAWKQSSNGDIASAFRSYERAMVLAEHADAEVLNNLMADTATLYVMHGDRDYVQKGVALQQSAIERFQLLKQEQPEAADYADEMIALIQHNIGIAHTLHLHDYAQALQWFDQVSPDYKELRRSALVFAALAAVELALSDPAHTAKGQSGKAQSAQNLSAQALSARARKLLAASQQAPKSVQVNTDYLDCYQQLVELRLNGRGELARCNQLPESTPLEVSLDLYKRMAVLEAPDWRLVGLEKLHELFVTKLELQLKQSSSQAASHAELSRLQLESKLKSELLEKEQALKQAEQEQHRSQTMLALAGGAILLLIILVIAVQLRQNRKLARQYRALSIRDGLTGLHNRRYFEHNIERELSFVKRSQQDRTGHSLALYLLDIDHFKKINDNYGHDAGDEVIIEFARRIHAAIRETDMLVRWGGEEFLLVARIEQSDEHHRVAERIRSVIAQQPFTLSNRVSLNVTCTIGAAAYPHGQDQIIEMPWNKLVQLADAALYVGKNKQRNTWVCVDNVLDLAALDQILSQDLELSSRQQQVLVSSQFGWPESGQEQEGLQE